MDKGHPLALLPSSINAVLAKMKKDKKSDFKDTAYLSSATDEQILEYLKGKASGKFTGKEEWAKAYEEEARKRKLAT